MSRMLSHTDRCNAYAEYAAQGYAPVQRSAKSEADRKLSALRSVPSLDAYAEYERVAKRTPVKR